MLHLLFLFLYLNLDPLFLLWKSTVCVTGRVWSGLSLQLIQLVL